MEVSKHQKGGHLQVLGTLWRSSDCWPPNVGDTAKAKGLHPSCCKENPDLAYSQQMWKELCANQRRTCTSHNVDQRWQEQACGLAAHPQPPALWGHSVCRDRRTQEEKKMLEKHRLKFRIRAPVMLSERHS